MTEDLITASYVWGSNDMHELTYSDTEEIRDLLLGHSVAKVADDHLRLDDGTLLKIIPNDGGCSCGAGDYELADLNDVENIITSVEFEEGDPDYDAGTDGYYRIFVLAGDKRINLMSVEGDDGNGYYGTGYSILVRKATR